MQIHSPGRIAALALMLCIATTPLSAQQGVVPARPTVNLTAEQHHIIKEIVLKDMKVPPATSDVRLAVGEAVSGAIALHSFPPSVTEKVPEVRSHSFFVKDDQVVVVNLKDHTIADVIK
jgi:hypothetical protein